MATANIDKVLIRHILFRKDTKANWELENPILNNGEPGLELPKKLKIGDGVTPWNDLTYYGAIVSEDPNSIAELDAEGALRVLSQIDDDETNAETTWSSEKINNLLTEKLTPVNVNNSTLTLTRATHASKNKYIRLTSLTPVTLTLNSAQNYQVGDVFNIRSVNSAISLVGTGVTINTPPNGSAVIPVRGTVTIVMVTPTEADVFGYTELL